MFKKTTFLLLCISLVCLLSCHKADNNEQRVEKINGVAAAGVPITGKIYAMGNNGDMKHCTINADGSFSVDVTQLKAPFVLWSDGQVNSATAKYYSTIKNAGYANVTPATHLIMTLALKQDPATYYASGNIQAPSESDVASAKENIKNLLASFYTKYGVPETFDPIKDQFNTDKTGFDVILETISMDVKDNKIKIKLKHIDTDLYEKDLATNVETKKTPEELATIASENAKPLYEFPKSFLWGTATAAHQVESDNTNNDWYEWEKLKRIKDNHSNLTGPDNWNNYELDFDIAQKQLGTNSYRMSIEWSKIEPEPDKYDTKVIAHYHAILDALIKRNIKPVVTLQHFTLPTWIHDPTPDPANDNKPKHPGWNDSSANPYIIERLVKFSEEMAKQFGSKVDWWITINEPLVMYANGFLVGDFPPGVGYKNEPGALNMPFPIGHHDTIKANLNDAYKTKQYGLKAGIQASKVIFPNIIKAHVKMYDAIKEFDKTDADGDSKTSMVSISKHHVILRPIGTEALYIDAYNQMQYLWNEMIWDAIITGQLDSDLDQDIDEDMTKSYGTFPKVDYIGFNYYARRDVVPIGLVASLLGVSPEEFDFFKGFPVDTSATGQMNPLLKGNNYNCLGWEIYPNGIKDIIIFYSEKYGKQYNLPIMITENGTDNDADRPGFVIDMIEKIGEAMKEGHNVIGYLHWSLMDNFEWERGYGQHFGLVRVDFDFKTKQSNRKITEGGNAFANIVLNRGIVKAWKDKYGTIDKPSNIRDDTSACSENQGGDEPTGKAKEVWSTILDDNKGSVSWTAVKAEDNTVSVYGEGSYKVSAMGNIMTVLFPFKDIPAVVSDSAISYTATGTASLQEMPAMQSSYTFKSNNNLGTYEISVTNPTWIGMLQSHPITGQSVANLISGSGITTAGNAQQWKATLDDTKGSATWDATVASDTVTVSGEGLYGIFAMGQNLTISLPFENVVATLSDSSISFTASGTAKVKEMPTMTSGYTMKINGDQGTYEIAVSSPLWQSMLASHPIVGNAVVTRVDKPSDQGNEAPLTTKVLNSNGLKVVINKNGTFTIQDADKTVLKSKGDTTGNGGIIWRNATITAQLPLAGIVQGGFLGHEKFSEQTTTQSPWISGLKVTQTQETEKGITATVANSGEVTQATLTVENYEIETISENIAKVKITAPNSANHVSCYFSSDSSERFYGFGSANWTTQHRGQAISIWVTEQLLGRVTPEDPNNFMELKGHAYDNQIQIPFFMSSKGYGVLLDTTFRSLFELCTEDHPSTWRLETWNNETSFYIFTGDNFIDLIKTYTAISGRPNMPPDWLFAPMNDAVRGEQNVSRVAKLIRDNKIPSSVIWTEDWLGIGSQATGFRLSHDWDMSAIEYPNLPDIIDQLHGDGFKFLGYFSPFIPNPATTPGHNEEKWKAANDNNYFFLNAQGTMSKMLVPPLIPPHGGGLDLTKSSAVEWYKTYVRQAAAIGLDGAMVDFGEWVPYEAVFADGRKAPEVHNEYPVLWQKANKEVWDQLVADKVKDDYLFYVRSGYTGSQKFAPAFWAGDQNTNWDRLDGIASVITMGINLGLSGISYFGHDIGGYSSFDTPQLHDLPIQFASMIPPSLQAELWDGVSSKELFLRWTALGAYTPMMRTHHGSRYGQNWSFEGGPNPNNFTITSNTITAFSTALAGVKSNTAYTFPTETLAAIDTVLQSAGNLTNQSYGTWVDIDTAIRNAAGNDAINRLAVANINVAKLILRYATQNKDNLMNPKSDPETLSTWKKFAKQHIELFPYLKAYAKQSSENGLPIMRHMILLYPDDKAIQNGIPDNEEFQKFSGTQSGKRPYNEMFQYFFGNELLVAPIIDQGASSRPVYLPKGKWYNIFTREYFSGPQTIKAKANIDEIPVFASAGSIIPRLSPDVETLVKIDDPNIVDYNDKESILLVDVFSGKDGTFKLADGTEFKYTDKALIDDTTTVKVNSVDTQVEILDKAIKIETPKSGDFDIVLSNGSELKITGSPILRSYIVTIIASTIPDPENTYPILDSQGREIILRGVNARIQGVFDVNFDDGREPLEPIPAFSKDDTDTMQKIGFNLLRLTMNWSAIEPEPNVYSSGYADKIGQVLDLCQTAGIYVMLDMHQDAYSKEIGEDGAPLWAIIPAPEKQNEGGHLDNLLALRFSEQVQKAFKSFWNNTTVSSSGKGLQDHFIDAMLQIMNRFKDHPAVIGMEVFNEPWLLHTDFVEKDIVLLHNFYKKAFAKLQEISPNKLIFFEPDVSKNYPSADGRPQYSAIIPETIVWNTNKTVYSPHLYVQGFILTGNPDPNDPEIIESTMNSVAEAKAFKAPLMIGEFGFNDKDPDYAATLDRVLSLADKHFFHTAQWVWKEKSQDAWGFYDFDQAGTPVLREKVARETSRAYPQAISGKIKKINFDRNTYALTVQFKYVNTGYPHIIFVPTTYAYTNGYDVTCDDEIIESTKINEVGKISVQCGQDDDQVHTLKVLAK